LEKAAGNRERAAGESEEFTTEGRGERGGEEGAMGKRKQRASHGACVMAPEGADAWRLLCRSGEELEVKKR
jgi:hypothetical protein